MNYFKEEDQYTKAITKILRQTQEGEISWKIDNRKVVLGIKEHLIGKIYTAKILEKSVRIYKYRQKYYSDEDNCSWEEGVRLQFIDYEGNPEWNFKYSNAVDNLYEIVAFQAANVQEFLDKWLTND